MSQFFPHENVKVYELSLEWIHWLDELLPQIPASHGICHQLDALASTIAVGIADAISKSHPSDRAKTLESARSSVLASAALMDILGTKNLLEQSDIINAKKRLSHVARLLSGMIQSSATNEIIRSRLSVPG